MQKMGKREDGRTVGFWEVVALRTNGALINI